MIAFIDDHRDTHGVEPICDMLPIAPATYYDHLAKRADPLRQSVRARGSPPAPRTELRKTHATPVFDDLEQWLAMQLATISGKSPLAGAIRYALTRMERLRPYLGHGILELDNNAAERGMRAIALGRKNVSVRSDRYWFHRQGIRSSTFVIL